METPIPLRRERLKGLHRQHTFIRWFISTALAMAVLYVLLFICFVAVDMGNDAMAPTLQQGDMVMVDRLGKHMRHVQRTDLVAFTGPEGQLLIRRVVALEGESISCRGGRSWLASRSLYRFRRRALDTTQKLDRLIAAAAIMGSKARPSPLRAPAAMGMPMTL